MAINDKIAKMEPEAKPERPVLSAEMAAYLVNKLDGPMQTVSHADRNNLAAVINSLVAIANWKEAE